ncbi:MAG: chromosomal replication initiator protein DnaA [Candidatus Vogelbacteria bacterium]|nr:chromosomal replication initiator protein DnaA [Candidatus Vogelbacteria bacterium]
MLDNKKLWEDAIAQIELTISKANFITWFKNTYIAKQDDNIIYVSVPNAFVRDWLLNKYHKTILHTLRELSENVRGIEYIIQREGDKERLAQISTQIDRPNLPNQLGINELYVNKEDNLNPKYVFGSFIVGSFNELAHAAAQAVIKKPGVAYNPLYIYGGTGLGKTHLIQAIGNHLKNVLNKKVFYITSERYVTELVDSMRTNTIHLIKEKYKKYDLLIMDDIQFFSGKEKNQEELFHLFNYFHENNKQIIFSSDKPPRQITKLEDRLRSRFEGGMIVDVSRPDYESKVAILRLKLKQNSFSLPNDVLDHIANSVSDNIRELEGVMNSIIIQSQLKNKELTINEVRVLIKNNSKQKKTVSIKDVVKTVSDFYNVEEKTIYEKTRRKEVVKPRQIAMYILRNDFDTSYPYIGQKMGGRDHTTVIHACEKIKEDIKKSDILGQEIEQIKNLLLTSQAVLNSGE